MRYDGIDFEAVDYGAEWVIRAISTQAKALVDGRIRTRWDRGAAMIEALRADGFAIRMLYPAAPMLRLAYEEGYI
jgi:hypothetical protein